MLSVAILAGGLATRLRPLTEKIPKSMVEVAGKPFIAWQLEYLYLQGIRHVVLCVGYLGEQIQTYIADGAAYGLKVDYVFDGPKLLGTGGALKAALPLLGNAFFVYYGDSYLPIDFRAVESDFGKQGKPALMTVLKNNNAWDKSNVLFSGNHIEYNKQAPRTEMQHIDYGLGILSASVLEHYPDNAVLDLADVYHRLSIEGSLAGHEVFQRFYEIGSHQGLQETIDFLKQGEIG
jgi:MurNAc alpha-1-phosphate uridylyltransferase